MRVASIMPLSRASLYPSSILPAREYLFAALSVPPSDVISQLAPQQVQHISLIAAHVHRSPVSLIRALKELFHRKNRKTDFKFLCVSAIPAFFGFFSSNEHLTLAFPFYSTLIGTADHDLVNPALVPF